ncbi:MAG TPA: glycosyltransferase family 1 protein [Pelomicrobium sp.]|nr:glycosyltransferase family 1 protein [Pelomicrobium sp.]
MQQLPAERPTLRVAVVTETYPPEINGVAMTLGRLVDGMRRRLHSVQLIRPRQGNGDAPSRADGFEELLKPSLPLPRYANLRVGLPARQALVRAWSLRRPDAVHIATEGPLGWSALQAATRLKLPVMTGFHTNFHTYTAYYGVAWLRKSILGYLRKFHNRAGATLVPTHEMLEQLAAEGFQRLRVVSRGVDVELFGPARRRRDLRKSWGVGDDDLAVIHVGRLAAEKNLPLVLRAFNAVKTRNPSARLVLVGDGPERRALEAGSPQHVYAGMRTGVDLAEHYASGDLFLFPSLTETYGNVTVEAMASGLAVVAFDYAAAREHIRHGENGLVAACDDADRFVSLAAELAADPQQRRFLGESARATALPLSWNNIHDEVEEALWDVIRWSEQVAYA